MTGPGRDGSGESLGGWLRELRDGLQRHDGGGPRRRADRAGRQVEPAGAPAERGGRRRGRAGSPDGGGAGPGVVAGQTVAVPPAEFASYYGRPIVKAPVWKHDIPAYLFTGGLAAGTALLAAGADLTGRPALRRAGRVGSLVAIGASTYFLINDLGRPARFHHMLRVIKPTSPMSMGTWILAAFGPAAGLAALSEVAPVLPRHGGLGLVRRLLPPAGRVAGLAAGITAPALATYTGVLLADTAMPAWHDAYPDLPFLFAGSALVAGSGAGLIATPTAQSGPAARLALAGAVLEKLAERRIARMGLTGEPYRTGRSARLLQAGQVLLAAGTAGALLGRRSRTISVLSGTALLASSVLTRFGVFEAGVASARDPKYTVLPQRDRLARRGAGVGGVEPDGGDAEGGAGPRPGGDRGEGSARG